VHGSSDLAQTLLDAQLIDEFRLWYFPVLIGKGKRLFRDGVPPTGLKLRDISTSGTGVIMTIWTRSGPIEPGSFTLSDESGLS
jgi:dihydrofolate reductase